MKARQSAWPLWSAALGIAAFAAVRLAQALAHVEGRYAFGWDPARRASLNMAAGDALRGGHPLEYLWYVAGPETWPTLRLVPASVLHALLGPGRAFAVEHALSIAIVAALVLAVAFAARVLTSTVADALLVLAVSTALLAGNGALLSHAADGMLETLSAALTTAAVAAWIAARQRGDGRPWSVAILGNLLFHTKWQHGLIFAAAVLVLEWMGTGGWPARAASLRSALRAVSEDARTAPGALLAVAAGALLALALVVGATGGLSGRLAGVTISLLGVHGPVAFGALAAFLFAEHAAWRGRDALRVAVPERLRFSWAWLVTPMAAWLLVPFTWRLRTIFVTSGTYDSGARVLGWRGRLLFYPDSAWSSWTPPSVHPLLVALGAATAVAAWRSPLVRRRLAPVAALIAIEWAVLTLATRHNYQARFATNLAPILAVTACAWLAAIGSGWLRAALGGLAAAVALAAGAPLWSARPLAAIVAEGFDPAPLATDCQRVLEPLPVERMALVNEAPISYQRACALWADVLARQRGARGGARGDPRAEVIVLTAMDDAAPAVAGHRPTAREVRSGGLRGTIYEPAR